MKNYITNTFIKKFLFNIFVNLLKAYIMYKLYKNIKIKIK